MFKGEKVFDKECSATRIEIDECEAFCNSVDNFIIKCYKLAHNVSLVDVTLCVHSFINDTLCGKIKGSLIDMPLGEVEELSRILYSKIFWNCYDRKGNDLIFNFLREISGFSKYTITECYENYKYFGNAYNSDKTLKGDL